MRLYHYTTHEAAARILADGFRNSSPIPGWLERPEGIPGGVFLADVPTIHATTGVTEGRMLAVEVPDALAQRYYIEGAPGELRLGPPHWREFCIPAEILNRYPVVEGSAES